ncbi:hypothetical protein [Streptomyces europaeiscabiei]|uniref:hypothetical protein n=1 Tax=Streptomyces europaeiscabiei TaxID=146819 RepID=UPI0038D42948
MSRTDLGLTETGFDGPPFPVHRSEEIAAAVCCLVSDLARGRQRHHPRTRLRRPGPLGVPRLTGHSRPPATSSPKGIRRTAHHEHHPQALPA